MYSEAELIQLASSSASLAEVPGKNNWIEKVGPGGNLPPYVRKLARGIMKSGKTKSQAIAIAIGRIKTWARGGGDVSAATRAKAAKALAQWTALKAKNKSKGVVKATSSTGEDYLMLTGVGSFNTEYVRNAWRQLEDARERAHDHAVTEGEPTRASSYYSIRELWSDHIIVSNDYEVTTSSIVLKVPYTITGSQVDFGDPIIMRLKYVEDDLELSENEQELLADVLPTEE